LKRKKEEEMKKEMKKEAERNLLWNLIKNSYPGRGIVVGLDETGEYMIQIYWIMGRSEGSRNRVLSCDDGRVFTEAADPSKMKDPSLLIYNAMRESGTQYVVSNGVQTDDIVRAGPANFAAALYEYAYESDVPICTPRISATAWWSSQGQPRVNMSILRRSRWDLQCDRNFYEIRGFGAGFGFCMTTYASDGNPPPPFRGEPYLVPLPGKFCQIADMYWESLDTKNRVALAVKFASQKGCSEIAIINEYEKVG